ncbi:MAG: D-alanyl-D-alanine carboxypeptidase [Candidatus Sumerlaeia bacterium]|nr:D-alanyl-D-alanine carboxypeptidase [Candidatus Sumerlaeia bacterium]
MRTRHAFIAATLFIVGLIASPATSPAETDPVFNRVSAWSWGIADARTGEVLHSKGLEDFRKSASITKSMTAHLIIRMLNEDPSLREEKITFSELAAATSGSSARIEEGESLRLIDALYGLMLPSGNDAGNALAEHFHERLDPPPGDETIPASRATRANFVAEMNRRAAELGMENTIYRIPFGDGGSASDHTSTAGDILKLGRAAMADSLFLKIVSTSEYTATVYGPDGSTREVTWTNTNQFLGEAGFVGIKTGTTRNAGACLLTAYHRDNTPVIVVVLGSEARELRYTDTRKIIDGTFQLMGEDEAEAE